MNQTNHTAEQYQLSMHIAALETIIAYSGSSIPSEERARIVRINEAMQNKLKEINLRESHQEHFEHIASFYETKH